jgi:hypothetical protein
MRYHPIIESGELDAYLPDPSHYVRLADVALLYGSRDEAESLITMAYNAFDATLGEWGDITELQKAWPEKNN